MVKRLKKTYNKVAKHPTYELPDEPKPIDDDLANYITLIYGREKIGKTTLAASFPGAIFLATEPGLRGLSVYSFNHEGGGVHDWSVFRAAVDALIKTKGKKRKFKTVVVDTVDRAYDMCLDWVCEERGIEYPGVLKDGKNDYGKSWRAVKQEFLKQIHRLVHADYGVVFISHAKEMTVTSRTGVEFDKIYPTMMSQARTVVEALVDFFFYAEYAKDDAGKDLRVLICKGDEMIWAGARSTPGEEKTGKPFPGMLPLKREDGYRVLQSAFVGDYSGLDIGSLFGSKQSTKTGASFITEGRAKTKRQGGAATKKVKKLRRKK